MARVITAVALALLGVTLVHGQCAYPSVTTVAGTKATSNFCPGDIVFQDEFDEFDHETWEHEVTLGGGGNWEFQFYNNNRTNSFVDNGVLYIRPSLLTDQFDEGFLAYGTLNLHGGAPRDQCTNPQWWGCERGGSPANLLNPIKSARLRTVESFSFRYGRAEIRAKMPAGDWLWPALWMMPSYNVYGTWPASGEIDLIESRGNRDMWMNGEPIGVQEAGSTLHFGPDPNWNAYYTANWHRIHWPGYHADFHRYQLEWTPDFIRFSIDDVELGFVDPGPNGFWGHGGFLGSNQENPWRFGSKMAPFDQKFHFIMNVAVGGTNGFFPDGASNPFPKPWANNSPAASTDFWNGQAGWLPTWNLNENNGYDAALQVDYVRVWAV